jgi:hypothetical protein
MPGSGTDDSIVTGEIPQSPKSRMPGSGTDDSIVTGEIPQSPKSRMPGTISSGALPEGMPFIKADAIAGFDRASRAAPGPSSPQLDARSPGGPQLDARSPGGPQLDHRSPGGPKRTPLIAVVLVAASLLGAGVFFGSKILQPSRQAVGRDQQIATLIASVGPSASSPKAIEQIVPDSLELEGPSGLVGTAPVELTKAPYFSTVVLEDGKEFTEFDFPKPGKGMGLAWIGTSVADSRRTEGKVRFAKDSKLYISPSAATLNVPQFFEKFRPGEIAGILITPFNASDQLLDCATRVPGLSQLLMGHCTKLTAKIIPSLNKLNLSLLDIAGSSIDGAQFAEGHFWQSLKLLNIGNCKNVSPILKQISGSTQLAVLDVSSDQLEVADYQLIATLPNLKLLNVNSNKVTTEDMHALSGLPKLAAIIAVYTRFADGLPVEELRHFPALKSLTILRGYLKTTDLQLLKQGCPHLKVVEVSADQMKAMGQVMQKERWDE